MGLDVSTIDRHSRSWCGRGGLGLAGRPAARQRRGMDAASAFARQLASKLAADPRFASVDTGVTTHPALRVYGEVPDEQSLRDLNTLVAAPPDAKYRVMVNVKVAGAAATRPAQ